MTLKIKNCYNILMHKGQKHLGPIPVLRGGVINELSSAFLFCCVSQMYVVRLIVKKLVTFNDVLYIPE